MATSVLIVDDSYFFRKRIAEIINSDPNLNVIGTASNGQEAIDLVQKLRPDVITMDFEMPVMDGITAVKKIMEISSVPILMLSTWTTEGAKSTLDALDAGAVDYLPKKFEDISGDRQVAQQKLCQRINHLANSFHPGNRILTTPQQTATSAQTKSSTQKNQRLENINLVTIATSTGGPVALQKILTQLPASFPHPILLIQHMPANFTPSFAERLNSQCKISIKHAVTNDILVPGTAYLAPGGQQMLLKGRKNRLYVEVIDGQEDQTYKPCVDVTLQSIAKICADETLSIVLTGMGSDGRDGCRKLHDLGGTVWSQDQQSSTIYGMPMAIAKAGIADRILSLNEIGRQLAGMN